jgi:hypothetical protein
MIQLQINNTIYDSTQLAYIKHVIKKGLSNPIKDSQTNRFQELFAQIGERV